MKRLALGCFVLFGACAANGAFVDAPDEPSSGSLVECEDHELIVNGGFENPAFLPGNWSTFTSVDGWKVSSGPGIEIQHRVSGVPYEGNQHIELDSNAPTAIYQDVPTQPGARYTLRFALTPRPGIALEDNAVLVLWNGKVIDEVVPQSVHEGWQVHEYSVVATGKLSRVELKDISVPNSLGAFLDDVSLRPASR